MIPLRDSIPRSRWPVVTFGLILANCYVFFQELSLTPFRREIMIRSYALIPARSLAMINVSPSLIPRALLPFFTSMFLHAGWLHLIGNMWFLWIFGDNVEDRLGPARYLFLYIVGGLIAAATDVAFSVHSTLPMLGASGAIAAVMGAYLITFPGARILTLVPFIFIFTVEIPAWVMLIYWFLLQFLGGFASISSADSTQGGVAWLAHVGGFAAGIPLMLMLRPKGRRTYATPQSW